MSALASVRPDKTYEEVDIEVPEAVYNTMSNNKPGGGQTGDRGRIAGLGRQIKCLFSSNTMRMHSWLCSLCLSITAQQAASQHS